VRQGGEVLQDAAVFRVWITRSSTCSATDSLKAIEVVRTRADEWHIDPAKIGIIGFSAGGWAFRDDGHRTYCCRPPELRRGDLPCCFNTNNSLNATNIKVPDDAPPLFLLHAYDDGISASSPSLFLAWKAANKPAELHSYAAGGMASECPPITVRPTADRALCRLAGAIRSS